jgi:hypothetical protein
MWSVFYCPWSRHGFHKFFHFFILHCGLTPAFGALSLGMHTPNKQIKALEQVAVVTS